MGARAEIAGASPFQRRRSGCQYSVPAEPWRRAAFWNTPAGDSTRVIIARITQYHARDYEGPFFRGVVDAQCTPGRSPSTERHLEDPESRMAKIMSEHHRF